MVHIVKTDYSDVKPMYYQAVESRIESDKENLRRAMAMEDIV